MNISPHRGAAKPCRNTLALTVPDGASERAIVIPGRAARREPGIQAFCATTSGFRVRALRTRPGMTGHGQRSLVLKSVAITCNLLFGIVIFDGAGALAADVPGDAEVLALVHKHCVPCHAAEPTHPAFAKPPARIMLETIEQVRQYAPRILTQVAETRAMPLGNETDMTDEERERIAAWIKGHQE
jgi:mono/diheme cytochrome c family protein